MFPGNGEGPRNDILRKDLFAAMLAQGIMGNETFLKDHPDPDDIANFCYSISEALIKRGRVNR